jgi:glycosyltransferase involved in cell wall biosynthesis
VNRFLVDAFDLGVNPKGINRVLLSLIPELEARIGERLLVACTPAGAELADLPPERLLVSDRTSQSRWEQYGLPRIASRSRVSAVYSHREAGALWGPPLVLHVPEDPEVRWARQPTRTPRELARRRYSRTLMRRSLQRAAVVAASVPTVARQLTSHYGVHDVELLPLGVDLRAFRPAAAPTGDFVFHLGSPDPRDRTPLVVEAYAAARAQGADLPPLVIGGALGPAATSCVQRLAMTVGISGLVTMTGRLTDFDLAERYRHAAVVIQPSSDEGFGLQPLEALASGAPLLITPSEAVADVVGDAAVVAPASPGALGAELVRLLKDFGGAAGLRKRGPQVAGGYSWCACAERVVQALELAASRPAASRFGPRQ